MCLVKDFQNEKFREKSNFSTMNWKRTKSEFYAKFFGSVVQRVFYVSRQSFSRNRKVFERNKKNQVRSGKTPKNLGFGDFFRQKSRNCLLNVQRCFCEITNYFENNTIKMSFRRFCANLFQVLQKRYFAALSTQQCTCPGDDIE